MTMPQADPVTQKIAGEVVYENDAINPDAVLIVRNQDAPVLMSSDGIDLVNDITQLLNAVSSPIRVGRNVMAKLAAYQATLDNQ